MTHRSISVRTWLFTSTVFSVAAFIYSLVNDAEFAAAALVGSFVVSIVCSLPVLLILNLAILQLEKMTLTTTWKIVAFSAVNLLSTLPYGLLFADINTSDYYNDNYRTDFAQSTMLATAILYSCSLVALAINFRMLQQYFIENAGTHNFLQTQINTNMETQEHPTVAASMQPDSQNNKTLIKAIVTGVLILAMLIPTLFVSGLVTEREARQHEVVQEVTDKWAARQTVSGPYLCIPYTQKTTGSDGKPLLLKGNVFVLPENLAVAGNILPEERPRSIYKVLLYKTDINSKGNFNIKLPEMPDSTTLHPEESRICIGISDFRGIEEKIGLAINGEKFEFSPGIPSNQIDSTGLSAPIKLTMADIGKSLDFSCSLKLRGSEQLHFVPLAANSTFSLHSTWSSPSFDGNTLPVDRTVDENGFAAKWTFNNANLPFTNSFTNFNLDKNNFGFGVTMVQPADQYSKTDRSIKYAILFIGLTFSLFFIVEIMQKKPFHPVQYVLVGLSLIIFFTLLLSISEFLLFDIAYLIAASSTILMITLYAKSHFQSWKVAGIFASVLITLYGFIFILIRLEDTALLVGSIGLFVVLAIVMYASRKINWYNTSLSVGTVEVGL